MLRLENVVPDRLDPGMYDVYVVAPDGARALVGTMSFFGEAGADAPEGHGAHAAARDFDFDLERPARELRLRPGDSFEVMFVATTGLEPIVPSARSAPVERRGPPPRIGRIGVTAE